MRKPQLHQRIGLDNIVGLTNYLTNNEKSIDDFIQETEYVENLKIMTSGTKPPDPIRLLGSNKLDTLFTELRESEEFDYIIIDCPPTIGMSDVNLLADKCDGAILIILKGAVNRALAKNSIENLKTNGANILGIISNSKSEKLKSSDSYYSNEYGYGYGYGYTYSAYLDENEKNEDENKINKFQKFFNPLKKVSKRFFDFVDN